MKTNIKNPETDMRRGHASHTTGRGRQPRFALLAALLAGISLAACEITNPGPVNDELVNDPEAHRSLVNGAGRELSVALSQLGYTGAIAARELMPGGQTGAGGHSPIGQAGQLLPSEVTVQWNAAQTSRWIAENAIERFTEVLEPAEVEQSILAQAYLWGGYANRILGENMCEAVFDGGPAEPSSRYFERAEQPFSDAISTGSGEVVTAAHAGRASVRVWLGDWAGATADAGQVPLDFEYLVATDGSDPQSLNDIYYSNAASPYRGYTIWMTFYEDYYTDTGDPRTPWGADPDLPLADQQLSGYGPVPWSFQFKYTSLGDPYRVSSGREMVLIRAEADLAGGNWQSAMTLINSLRTSQISDVTGEPLEGWVASTSTEAWTFLKRERSIELWLEARRLGDLRRWADNGTPGEIDWPDFESISQLFIDNPPSDCFPIPDAELNTNPNLGE